MPAAQPMQQMAQAPVAYAPAPQPTYIAAPVMQQPVAQQPMMQQAAPVMAQEPPVFQEPTVAEELAAFDKQQAAPIAASSFSAMAAGPAVPVSDGLATAGSDLARARAIAQRLGITNLTDDEYDIPTYMRRQQGTNNEI
jgi:hypothetical protein